LLFSFSVLGQFQSLELCSLTVSKRWKFIGADSREKQQGGEECDGGGFHWLGALGGSWRSVMVQLVTS
jgi:hypothetical protein